MNIKINNRLFFIHNHNQVINYVSFLTYPFFLIDLSIGFSSWTCLCVYLFFGLFYLLKLFLSCSCFSCLFGCFEIDFLICLSDFYFSFFSYRCLNSSRLISYLRINWRKILPWLAYLIIFWWFDLKPWRYPLHFKQFFYHEFSLLGYYLSFPLLGYFFCHSAFSSFTDIFFTNSAQPDPWHRTFQLLRGGSFYTYIWQSR